MTLFFRNPRLLATAIGLIVVAGISAMTSIVRQEDPTITNGIAVVVTPFPGASAERVEALVTEKIEDELRELAEIQTINSFSRNGVSVIAIELDENIQGKDAEEGLSKIRDALDDARPHLPPGVPSPIFDDERFGSYAIELGVVWVRESEPERGILKRFGEELQDRLRDIGGTDAVRVFGAPQEEIHVSFAPEALAAAGLTAGQVAQAISRADAKVAAGVLRGDSNNILIEFTGALDSLERIRRVPLSTTEQGVLLRVGDIAQVERTVQDPPTDLAIVNGRAAVVVAAQLVEGKRFDQWASNVHSMLDDFSSQLPDGIVLETVFDQSHYTQARLADLVGNLITGLFLVIGVLFVTLGARAALIVAVTLPLVSLASIAVLRFLGVPIHQMSVTGLIVALGLLVDNAIVVVDAIRSKRLDGVTALEAVRESLRHLWSPLLSSTITTVLAFMPILLLRGRVGEFVGTIGLSVIVALVSSYLVAMTIVPALSGLFLEGGSGTFQSFWTRGIVFPRAGRFFERSIEWSLRHPKRSMLLATSLPVLGIVGALFLPQQFFPSADRDQFHIEMRLPEQASIEETARTTKRVDEILNAHPEVVATSWFVGRSAPPFYYNLKQEQDGTPSYTQGQVRVRSAQAVQELLPGLQDELDEAVPGAQILLRELLQGPPVDAPVEVRVYGPDLHTLRRIGEELRERMSRVVEVTHTLSTLTASSPKIWLRADENEANLAGLRLVDMASQLNVHLEGAAGGSVLEGTEEIPVRVRVSDDARSTLERIRSTSLLSSGTAVSPSSVAASTFPGIPLESLVEVELRPVLDAIPHRNGRRVNIVRGYTDAGVSPEAVFKALQAALEKDPVEIPVGYRLEIGGDIEERGEAMGNLFAFIPVLVLLMLATVALSLNSFRLSGLIFAVAFQSVGLGLLSLTLVGYPLGFLSMIGLVGLVGVAINAAIVINSALRANRDAVGGSITAIREVVVGETSRHIISTTITTFGGFLPLILSSGGFWPPFATGIAGGVLMSTVISFYFVPAAFLLITRRRPVSTLAEANEASAETETTNFLLEAAQ